MPRDLGDVLHYFLPELGAPDASGARRSSEADVAAAAPSATRADTLAEPAAHPLVPAARPPVARRVRGVPLATLPVVAAPIGDQDVVRAALLWNLAVEVARHGGRSLVLRPEPELASTAWPAAGRGPMGVEVVSCRTRNLGELYRAAVDLALLWASEAPQGGLIFVQVPPTWLHAPGDGASLLRWMLLFSSCDPSDIRDTYGLAKLALRARPSADIGVTIHGARSRQAAERAYQALARTARDHLGCPFESYGLLVDDLHVYRAVVAGRPIGLAHPQSLAARALHDVAGLLLADARQPEPR